MKRLNICTVVTQTIQCVKKNMKKYFRCTFIYKIYSFKIKTRFWRTIKIKSLTRARCANIKLGLYKQNRRKKNK